MRVIVFLSIMLFSGFVQNTNPEKVKFFIPESAYGEYDLPKNYQKLEYIGLFEGKNGFYSQKTNIKTVNLKNDYDDSFEKQVKVNSKDECKLLILNKKIADHSFKKVTINDNNSILPNFTQTFDYLGQTYTIYTTGKKTKSLDGDIDFQVGNYKLFISTVKNGKKITQLIYSVNKFNERMPSEIELAGDIDGDGRLDLFMDISDSYAGAKYALFLSSNANYNEIFHLVADYQFSGC